MTKLSLISVVAGLAAVPVMAQVEPPEDAIEEEEARRYTVEVIIFSYEEDVAVGTEVFPPDEPPEVLPGNDLLDEAIAIDEMLTEEEKEEPREIELLPLPEAEFTMNDIARKFALLDVYESIMHFGWTQPTYPEEETLPIGLRVFGQPPAGLDGTFTLYLSRFLHLVVDLELEAPGQQQRYYGDQPDYDAGRTFYRIQEDRIFKSGDIRYFDHPRFGVVAKITREEEEEIADGEELLGGRTP